MKIKKGDTVKVISGKDKGKTGRVLEVLTQESRVRVEGVSLFKRHYKAGRSQDYPEGGIVERNGTIDACKVMLVDPTSGKTTRVGIRIEGDKKVRVGRGALKGAVLDTK